MPFATIKRTGASETVRFVIKLCAVYVVFSPTITAWITSNVPEPARSQVLAWLGLIPTVCNILKSTPLP